MKDNNFINSCKRMAIESVKRLNDLKKEPLLKYKFEHEAFIEEEKYRSKGDQK